MHSPPGSHKLSSRAATLTPSPKMSPLSPMMSRYLLHAGGEHQGFAGLINRGFDRIRKAYGRGLDLALHGEVVQ